ncbi:AfsR/SARP family transcriptional regulator [Streptomyces sp. NPDC088794]|uniref:AfsR/SARP family transcriptional regulator n=1 Tax=Streptomyces sp. NPDC088794 TaxID=3365902 RepID=UPI0037F97319
MDLRLLGPLELWAAGRRLDLGQPRQRAVLAALGADAGRPVTMESLVDRIWDDTPPSGARAALYPHVSRIRRLLEEAARAEGCEDRPPLRLLKVTGGYVLEAQGERVDLLRFRRLVARARDAHRDDNDRSELLGEALDLWRGIPLAGLAGTWAERMRTALGQERLDAAIAWARTETRTGHPLEVVGRMRGLTAEYPLVEPLAAELVRALAASGRNAEALECYTLARRRLMEELGSEPGAELRAVHDSVLRSTGEPPRRETAPPAAATAPARPVPAQLPADVPAFTGRAEQLAELSAHLVAGGEGRQPATAVVISAVSGTAGVGKTALAVRWAHRTREEFPDGQLYVNLRGFDVKEPVSAAEALSGFLAALGVPGRDIPQEPEDRAARYRTELSGRRLLIVLDNASSAEQVRPLLPGTSTCKVLVTSRDSLAGLVAVHGAHRLVLDLLPPADAIGLLRTLVGGRVDAEPEAAAALSEQCGRLPLALRVAAELALSEPEVPLAELSEELTDHRKRLDLLDVGGDPRAAVRAVFSWSYQRLPADAATAFRLLGLHPGPDFDTRATAALAGVSLHDARRTVAVLTRAHLIQPMRPGRYGMHDLLRVYAAWQAETQDTEHDRDLALDRLFDHYLAGAAAAMDLLHPAERRLRPRVTARSGALPHLTDAAQARQWLDTEQRVLVTVCAEAAARGRAVHATRTATVLHRYFESGGHFADALVVYAHAGRAAREANDIEGEADVLTCLGVIQRRLARYEAAATHHQQALALYRRIGNRTGEARNLTNQGVLHELRGQYRQALDCHGQAVTLFRQTGDPGGQADALNNLGIIHELLHEYEAAADNHRQALALYQEAGHVFGEASALGNLGIVQNRLGDHTAAADTFQRILTAFRGLGHRSGEAHALSNLGETYARLDRYETAADHQRKALALFRRIGERYGEVGALNGLGEALHGMDQPAEALAAHTEALTVAQEIEDQEEQARAHIGMAGVHQETGAHDRAREHWRHALDLYTALNSPRTAEVRDRLAALDADARPAGTT